MIFKKKLPNKIVKILIDRYENESLFLNKNKEYFEYRNLLLTNKKTLVDEFENFINKTNNDKYTYFDFYKKRKISNSPLESDIKFKNFLYVKLISFSNISNKFSSVICSNSLPFLILDLRENIGGDIEECAKIANLLLPKCDIVNLKYKYKMVSYLSDENFKKFDKIFVFVGNHTISSAEILALSLKYNLNNVFVLGNKTFEKNIGQTTYINSKYNYIFNLSTFEWNVCGQQSDKIVDRINENFKNSDDYFKAALSLV